MAEAVNDHLVEVAEDDEKEESETRDVTDSASAALSDTANSQLAGKLESLLQDESHKIVLTIPLESCHANRTRHLVIVSAPPNKSTEDIRYTCYEVL